MPSIARPESSEQRTAGSGVRVESRKVLNAPSQRHRSWLSGAPPIPNFAPDKRALALNTRAMFSHVVIFWTDPKKPNAAADLLAGAKEYLADIPGTLFFHVGKMATSHRPVVDQSYQVALNLVFKDKATQDAYQDHPRHLEFVEKAFKPNCLKVVIYDFE